MRDLGGTCKICWVEISKSESTETQPGKMQLACADHREEEIGKPNNQKVRRKKKLLVQVRLTTSSEGTGPSFEIRF